MRMVAGTVTRVCPSSSGHAPLWRRTCPQSATMTEFLEVVTSDEARQRLGRFPQMCSERIPIDDALGRYLAEESCLPRICLNILVPPWTATR